MVRELVLRFSADAAAVTMHAVGVAPLLLPIGIYERTADGRNALVDFVKAYALMGALIYIVAPLLMVWISRCIFIRDKSHMIVAALILFVFSH